MMCCSEVLNSSTSDTEAKSNGNDVVRSRGDHNVEKRLSGAIARSMSDAVDGKRILICSENVPPQVNGIARRVGHYIDGLQRMNCKVDLLCPNSEDACWMHSNPWNFTAAMMILHPSHFFKLMMMVNHHDHAYDVVHVVMPLNLSGIWLLTGCMLLRTFDSWHGGNGTSDQRRHPALVISWHCNLLDYAEHHFPAFLIGLLRWIFFDITLSLLPKISDRVLTPTKATEKALTSKWGETRAGVCYTGLSKSHFHPDQKHTEAGKLWQRRKSDFLQATNCQHLLLCVGRLSPEKGIDELLHAMTELKKDSVALWLVGDGPDRCKYELVAKDLNIPVHFWGYQHGEALHSVYTMADCFVCPSLTETFGQIIQEALGSAVRIAVPAVKVFTEAYGDHLPPDAFWQPLDRGSMVRAIRLQLERHAEDSPIGKPEIDKLKSWDDACHALVQEYEKAESTVEASIRSRGGSRIRSGTMLFLPMWFALTLVLANYIYMLSLVRSRLGGLSLRYYVEMWMTNSIFIPSKNKKLEF